MNKRTLLVVLVLLSVACAYASTVTIIYPTPVEGLDSHLANTTTAHDTAATKASLATLSADVVTRAGINGSSTQNFSVATLTTGNVTMPWCQSTRDAPSQNLATDVEVLLVQNNTSGATTLASSTGVFLPSSSGIWRISGNVEILANNAGSDTDFYFRVVVKKNGTTVVGGTKTIDGLSWGGERSTNFVFSSDVSCVTGDQVAVYIIVGGMTGCTSASWYGGTPYSSVVFEKIR
jgi:hypothetical protein